jgi:hypothetical protein
MSRLSQLAREIARRNPKVKITWMASPDWAPQSFKDQLQPGVNWLPGPYLRPDLYVKDAATGVVLGPIIACPSADGPVKLTDKDYETAGLALLAEEVERLQQLQAQRAQQQAQQAAPQQSSTPTEDPDA